MTATALISIRLGQKRGAEAEAIIGNAFFLFIFIKPLLLFFGASVHVLPYATDYMRIILLGTVFMAIGTGMNNFIRAEGSPKTAMYTMLIGAATNIVLDYVFIFIFHWGIKGAAAATVISYSVTSTWVAWAFSLSYCL